MNTPLCLGALCIYFVLTLLIGSWTKRNSSNADSFLYANRSLPLAVVAASYLAANSGALEAVGLSAMAAQYGVQAFHFYWIGAIPAMVFVALWLMPLYRRSGVISIPEWLELRYGPRIRLLNSCMLLIMLPLISGIGLYASSLLLQVLTGIKFVTGLVAIAGVVLAYVLLGGIRATMYTEILQLLAMVSGLGPLGLIAVKRLASAPPTEGGMRSHLWTSLPFAHIQSPMDVVGTTLGLGFVLSFGYWCTDFRLMQRAFAAKTDEAAQLVPLIGGFGKLLFSMLVVLPGLAAVQAVPGLGGTMRYDQATPALMQMTYGPLLMAVGFTALSVSLTSALGVNVTAFGAVWVNDIYRRYLAPKRSDAHYLIVGRVSLLAATLISVSASFLSFRFGNLMEQGQLIFATFTTPIWALVLLGVLTRSVSEKSALMGFSAGIAAAMLHFAAFTTGHLAYGSRMTADFYCAIYSFSTTIVVARIAAYIKPNTEERQATVLLIGWRDLRSVNHSPTVWILALTLLASCALLNFWWR